MLKKITQGLTLLSISLFFLNPIHAEESKVLLGVAPSFTMKSKTLLMDARVEDVNLETRKITLKGPEGNIVSVEADPKLKNLEKLKVGDLVKMKYKSSIVWKLMKLDHTQDTQTKTVTQTTMTALPGGKPSLQDYTETQLIAKIEDINSKNKTARLRSPEGKTFEIRFKDPKVFKGIQVGDPVSVHLTKATAVSFKPAKQ